MPVVVEPRVSHEKLLELLAIGTETSKLDFKGTVDLGETRDKVELAKDVGAMMVEGGFIVFGVDGDGQPTGALDAVDLRGFDEANLRQMLGKWIPELPQLLVATHEIDSHTVVLLYIEPSEHGLNIFKANGQYPKDPTARKIKTHTAFREGDVVVRDGTRSVRWQHRHIARVRERIRSMEKDRWRKEAFDEWKATVLDPALEALGLARGPAAALSWRLDSSTFEQTVVEQFRNGDDIPLRLLLEQIPADAIETLCEGQWSEFNAILDRLAIITALAIRLERPEWLDHGLGALARIYGGTYRESGIDQRFHVDCPLPSVRLAVIVRVMGLGALAVRKRRWDCVRGLTLVQPDGGPLVPGEGRSWIRDSQVLGARHDLFIEEDQYGRRQDVGFLSVVLSLVKESPWLSGDVVGPDEETVTDRLLSSITQFDTLAMLTVYGHAPEGDYWDYYPSFARYYWSRIAPALERLVVDPEMRAAIYPPSDQKLALDIERMLKFAAKEGVRYGGGGPGFNAPRLQAFMIAQGVWQPAG